MPESNSARGFLQEGPSSPPRPPSPSTPASWPVCGPASPLPVFRALGPGAGPSWSALQERGLLGDPQSGLGSGWCRVWGWGGSRPTDGNSEYSPAWAANRFQIGGVRARAAAAWLHKQPVAPDGGWLQPGEQVHGGLGGGSRWRTPTLPGWGREAPASRPWLPLIPTALSQDAGPEGAVAVEPIAWRRETEAQKGQGTVPGWWLTEM